MARTFVAVGVLLGALPAAAHHGGGGAVIFDFPGGPGGGGPSGEPTVDPDTGAIFGVAIGGGIGGNGIVYRLSPPASPGGRWIETVLHRFTGKGDGGVPFSAGSLALDPEDGSLYGTAFLGGNIDNHPKTCLYDIGCGVVFKLTANRARTAYAYRVIHAFTGADGTFPNAGVTFGPDGALYGTTAEGGSTAGCLYLPKLGCGTVFRLSPANPARSAWSLATIHVFTDGDDGGAPHAPVAFPPAGPQPAATGGIILYGTTSAGGAAGTCGKGNNGERIGCGIVFRLAQPAGGGAWGETVLHAFSGGADGSGPTTGVNVDVSGSVYGTTPHGGSCADHNDPNGCGVAFSLTPVTAVDWSETVLLTFAGGAGEVPSAPLTVPAPGSPVLYGTTSTGGTGCGVAYELTAPDFPGHPWTDTTRVTFSPGIGCMPAGGVVPYLDGDIVGTAIAGGAFNRGVVFKGPP